MAAGDYDYCTLTDESVIAFVLKRAQELELQILSLQLEGVQHDMAEPPPRIDSYVGQSERVLDVLFAVSGGKLGRKLIQ
jgi:hypothetical protein